MEVVDYVDSVNIPFFVDAPPRHSTLVSESNRKRRSVEPPGIKSKTMRPTAMVSAAQDMFHNSKVLAKQLSKHLMLQPYMMGSTPNFLSKNEGQRKKSKTKTKKLRGKSSSITEE